MGMTIDTVNQWLKIQRQNLKDFPEIASDKKIESLDTAISYLEDYQQLVRKYQKIEDIYYHQRGEALENSLRAALEQEPTTKNNLGVDAVSRKAVINQIFYSTDNNGDVVLGSALRERIARLPSVTPIRPKGHWIDKQHSFETCSAECSSCHERSNGYVFDNGFSLECEYYDYCPKCGSDNREVEE